MAKMQALTNYKILGMVLQRANFLTNFGLGKEKSQPHSRWRSAILGDVPWRAPVNPHPANSKKYSGMGENTPLAKGTDASKDDWGGPEAEKLIVFLKDDFLEKMRSYDSLLVLFYTTWCSHCKRLKITYGEAAAKMTKDGVSGHLGAIDLTKRMDIADKFDVVAVPMLKYFRKGQLIMVYNENRTADDIVNFMRNPPEKPTLLPKIDI